MHKKRTSHALLTLVAIHIILVLIASLYFMTQTQTFKNLIGVDVLNTPAVLKPPQVQKPIIKPIPKPDANSENKFLVESIDAQSRQITVGSPVVLQTNPQFQLKSDLSVSTRNANVRAQINPELPRIINPNVPKLDITTDVDLPVSTSLNSMHITSLVASLPSPSPALIGRNVAGHVQVKVKLTRPSGLSMVENVGVTESALVGVISGITLGDAEISSNNDGDPCGIVVGRGREIRGIFRFGRVRHTLSDWWANSSALNSLTNWLNEKTKIRTDMSVDGGSFKLTDANLQKSPLVFLTGHDPAFTLSRNLYGTIYGGGKLDNRFSDAEAAGLRKYLVERGGFLVFDDCGVNAPAQAMVRLFLSQMRFVMPEFQVERVKNKHEIYHNFYSMGGPPVGFDIFWWGTRPPRRNFLEGISVGEKLSVLVIRRDYMCAMETVSIPTRNVHYSPSVYRFMTNVVVYALTSGGISDYSRYVPQETLVEKKLPTHAPKEALIGAIK